MDFISTKPTNCTFRFNPSIPKTNPFSSSNSTPFAFSKKTPISLCCKNPESKPSGYAFPLNPILFLVPLFRGVKKFASSRTQKWASCVQAYSDSEQFLDHSDGDYLHSGAIGMALLSVTANAKVRISPFVATLAANPTFVSGMLAWFIAQSVKIVLNFFVERKWDFRILFASGGMPSSHTALCTALTTSVALCHGIADSLFPVCLGFSLIVMYDAIGVRRHAGMQAQVLNMIVEDLFQGHPISQRKLKELLGHTPSQVFAGAVLGIVVAYICCQSCLVAT